MCRFLIAKSTKKFIPETVLKPFSDMAQKSRAFDGDLQKDGWGMSWWNNGTWEQYVSIKPIWEDNYMFSYAPKTTCFVIHARSASFAEHENEVAYNQPFIHGMHSFVFNGLLKGVRLPYKLEGTIGSQKIFSLVGKFLKTMPTEKALEKAVESINTHSRFIQALNIGICDGSKIFAYTQYAKYPQYYHLQYSNENDMQIVSSEAIYGFNFSPLINRRVYIM